MDRALIDRIARSVLYEGYMLYPYRPSSLKNAKRWTFGTLYPESRVASGPGPDRSNFQAEVLFAGPATATVSVLARFLMEIVETESVEREVPLESIPLESTVSEARSLRFAEGELTFRSTRLSAGTHKLTVTL